MDKSMTELRSVTCHMGSHSVTWHPTQVSAPRLNASHAGRYSIYLPRRDGRLSWPCYSRRESNSRLLGPESNALTTEPPSRSEQRTTIHSATYRASERGRLNVAGVGSLCRFGPLASSRHWVGDGRWMTTALVLRRTIKLRCRRSRENRSGSKIRQQRAVSDWDGR